MICFYKRDHCYAGLENCKCKEKTIPSIEKLRCDVLEACEGNHADSEKQLDRALAAGHAEGGRR